MKNPKPTEAQSFGAFIRSECSLLTRRTFARVLLAQGQSPRQVRKYLALSGRQFRKARAEAKLKAVERPSSPQLFSPSR